MDINVLIAQTINTLSQTPANSGYHAGEITLAEAGNTQRREGGREASREEIDRAVNELNGAANKVDPRVSFEFNEKTKRLVMKMTDPSTSEIIKQMPSRDVLRILENIHDMLGVFIDEQR